MYLNDGEEFVREFFERTKKIVEQYEECNLQYDTTLLCNCLIGLLVCPTQEFYKKLKDKNIDVDITENSKQILKSGLTGKDKPQMILDILKHMRNAVSHGHMKFKAETSYISDNNIRYICFYDDKSKYNDNSIAVENFEFKLVLDIDNLKKVLFEVCENLFKKGNESKK